MTVSCHCLTSTLFSHYIYFLHQEFQRIARVSCRREQKQAWAWTRRGTDPADDGAATSTPYATAERHTSRTPQDTHNQQENEDRERCVPPSRSGVTGTTTRTGNRNNQKKKTQERLSENKPHATTTDFVCDVCLNHFSLSSHTGTRSRRGSNDERGVRSEKTSHAEGTLHQCAALSGQR